ncbi:MAG: VWA domain-containing protein [Vicinamibacterales bacterium]
MKSLTRRVVASLVLASLMAAVAVAHQGASQGATLFPSSSLRITSPLGRTGLVTRVRIVAQVTLAPGALLSPVEFFVDGIRVGAVQEGPPYAVEWLDENPFERREITVQAAVSTGELQRDTVSLPPFEVVEKAEVTGVLLETSVYDKSGRFVSDLPPSAFSVTEDGVEQTIDFISRETVETDLVLLVDNSQSMSRRIDYVRRATERLTAGLRPNDRAIVAPFNAHIGSITGPTNDEVTLRQAIGAMRASGGTALLDGLMESTTLLSASNGRRAIVLITDGYDENSIATVDEVVRAVQDAQATVYAMAIGGVAGISMKGETTLRRIAEQSGGRIFFPARESELIAASETIATDTHSRYLITYTPKNQRKDGRWRTVAVGVPDGLRARTRAGYHAPEPPPIRPTIEFTLQDDRRNYIDVASGDLDVYEDDVLQRVDTFQEAVDPVSIVLTLDSSGSMKKSAELVKSTAIDFVRAVRPEDNLALITFADAPRFAHVLATNRQWSIDAIRKYTANGGTALYDALWNSLQHLKDVKGRRSIVLLSDGRDENNPGTAPGSTHVFDEVLKLQRDVRATIYAVGLGQHVDRPVLEALADVSGGQTYYADDATALGAQFHRIVEDLRRRYVLSYASTNRLADGNWRKVDIRPRTSGQVVTSSGGYFAPSE